MVILSLDSSSKCTGWSVIEVLPEKKLKLMAFGEIKLTSTIHGDKLLTLFKAVQLLIDKYKPNKLSIEDIFFGLNAKTYACLAEYRGVCILAMASKGKMEYETYTASQVRKRAFADGKLPKIDVCNRLSYYFNETLATRGLDQSDATALACATANVFIPDCPAVPIIKKPTKRKK